MLFLQMLFTYFVNKQYLDYGPPFAKRKSDAQIFIGHDRCLQTKHAPDETMAIY